MKRISIISYDDDSLMDKPPDYWRDLLDDAQGVVILFRNDDRDGLDLILLWLRYISVILDYFLPILIVCHKASLNGIVTDDEVRQIAQRYDLESLVTRMVNYKEIMSRMNRMYDEFTFLQSHIPELW